MSKDDLKEGLWKLSPFLPPKKWKTRKHFKLYWKKMRKILEYVAVEWALLVCFIEKLAIKN